MLPIHAMPYVPGRARGVLRAGFASAGEGVLSIVDAAEIPRLAGRPAGILTFGAAPLSHVMIRLFGAGIPTVILERGRASALPEGEEAAIDGATGLICAPDGMPADTDQEPFPTAAIGSAVATADGVAISLRASIAGADGALRAVKAGAEAIGLVRSEYLMPNDGSMPDADYYRTAFSDVFRAAAPLQVRVRLLDLASDKRPSWLPDMPGVLTGLGLQGARLFDREPVRALMEAQVDALSGIEPERGLSLLIPFITDALEFRRRREAVVARLPSPVPIGAMAETPASVLALPELLEEGGFAGIGCNDLLQCLFAADRDLPTVAHLVDPYAPAVYRFLHLAAQLGSGLLDRVQLCGLLPQLPGVLPVMIGLGFRAFSVEPLLIPRLAREAQRIDTAQAEALAREVCKVPESRHVHRLLGLSGDSMWGVESFDPAAGLM